MSDKDERAQRLAAQLRANLHRRKAQARAAGQPHAGGAPGSRPPGPHGAAPGISSGSSDDRGGAED